jgi:hypothetical protein
MNDLCLEGRISFCFLVDPLPLLYFLSVSFFLRHAVAQLVEALRYKQVQFPMMSLTQSFRPPYGPGVDSASNGNEYQEYFLGVKAAGA